MSEVQATIDILESYHRNGGFFEIPTGVISDIEGLLEEQEKEINGLNNIINELEKCIKDKYYRAIDYQAKIRQSDLMQGDYPVNYYLEEQNEQLCNYFLNRLKDLQELKGDGSNDSKRDV
ncbi:MAG: hypothetical protein IJ568_06260 [Bacilli bacterium]|nr:hypothetical protein [Bacilli bacterium]